MRNAKLVADEYIQATYVNNPSFENVPFICWAGGKTAVCLTAVVYEDV